MKHSIELLKDAITQQKWYLENATSKENYPERVKYISELESELQQLEGRGWISVEERLPENQDEVLVHAPDCDIIGATLIGRYFQPYNGFSGSWTVYDFEDAKLGETVTHWMPLPLAPKLTPNK